RDPIASFAIDPRGQRLVFLTARSMEFLERNFELGIAAAGKVDKFALKWDTWQRVAWDARDDAVAVWGRMIRGFDVSLKGKLAREPSWSRVSRDSWIGHVAGRAIASKHADAIEVEAPDAVARLPRRNPRSVIWAKFAEAWFSTRSL